MRGKVFHPVDHCEPKEPIVDFCWALTWKVVDGRAAVKARLVAKGSQDPDPQDAFVETAGCVSPRPSHLRLTPLSAVKKGKLRS